MKGFLLALVLVGTVLGVERADAQTPAAISVNIQSAEFQWQWAPDPVTKAMPDRFVMTCGTVTHAITDITLRKYPVKLVITAPGAYTCTIRAENSFGKSTESNTVNFSAGDGPAAVPSFSIIAS